jgi:bile acid-coenzyme A ligase
MIALADVPSLHSPSQIALIHGDQRWTFGDLDTRSAQWAQFLQGRGARNDDLIAFSRANGPDFFALTFGIYRAGATPAPISPKLPAFERDAILSIMKPRLFVGPDQMLDHDSQGIYEKSGHRAVSWKACTSGGSTGRPKVIVDGRPAAFARSTQFIGIPEDTTVLVPGPLYHNASFSAAIVALLRGSAVITMDRFDARQALQLIETENATWSVMVPTMMHRIWNLPQRDDFDLSSWNMVVHTAAPMPQWLKREWINWKGADHVWEVYGSTEGLVRCWIGGREWLERPGSVGRPLGGARVRILGPSGAEVPIGEIGEIFAMPEPGPQTSYRYIGAERRSADDGWESVGDCGYVDADGYLFLADRRTDLIISGGVNIWPAEVEGALLRHPEIESCAVVGEDDPDLGQRVRAVIQTQNTQLDVDVVCEFLSKYLSRTKHPRVLTLQRTQVRDDAGKFRKSKAGTELSPGSRDSS